MKILFVINPAAGGSSHEKTILSLKELLKAKGFEGQFYFTSGASDEKIFARYSRNLNLRESSPAVVTAPYSWWQRCLFPTI